MSSVVIQSKENKKGNIFMQVKMYGLKDNVEGEFIFFFQAKNDGLMRRAVKGALLGKETNVFTSNMKDKSVFDLGEINTLTGEITPNLPVFACNVSDVRLELIKEIKIAKAEAGEVNPDASEVAADDQ